MRLFIKFKKKEVSEVHIDTQADVGEELVVDLTQKEVPKSSKKMLPS